MARNPSAFAKRQRDLERQRKRAARSRRKEERRDEKSNQVVEAGVDPDIAGIVPGPQAQPWMDGYTDDAGSPEDDDQED